MCRIMDPYHEYLFAKNESPCYNDERNQSPGIAMIIRPTIETVFVQVLVISNL